MLLTAICVNLLDQFNPCPMKTVDYLLGGMAHTRRTFGGAKDDNRQLANEALDYFKQLYYFQ